MPSIIPIAIILFIAFTIGLNLGLHGVILIKHQTYQKLTTDTTGSIETTKTEESYAGKGKATDLQKQIPNTQKYVSTVDIKKPPPARQVITPAPTEAPVSNPLTKLQKRLQDIDRTVAYEMRLKAPIKNNPLSETPIVLLTCCRPQLLLETLKSLLNVRGVDRSKVVIIQDGNAPEIPTLAKDFQIKLIQNTASLRLRGGLDGAARIAQHYRFALTTAFDIFDKANAIIIIEDDLLFSPDFYEYLTHTGMILLEDPSSFVVSAWNDNGFRGKVYDPHSLRRTEFFPGLGWLLTRKLYKNELEKKWPNEHWDHWLRSPEIHQYRETIYPQIPRTYHNGIKGTFMDLATHNRYFKEIDYNQAENLPPFPSDNYQQGHYLFHEKRVQSLLQQCHHLTSIEELITLSGELICLWISVPVDVESSSPPFAKISSFFGLWHEHKRGNHKGLHEFYFYSNYILLLNIDASLLPSSSAHHHNVAPIEQYIHAHYSQLPNFETSYHYFTYQQFKPKDIPIISRESFHSNYLVKIQQQHLSKLGSAFLSSHGRVSKEQIKKGDRTDRSCDEICRDEGKVCDGDKMNEINHCDYLQLFFPCERCVESLGPEQPAYVDPTAPQQVLPGACLYNQDPQQMPILCHAKHPNTIRLCVCK